MSPAGLPIPLGRPCKTLTPFFTTRMENGIVAPLLFILSQTIFSDRIVLSGGFRTFGTGFYGKKRSQWFVFNVGYSHSHVLNRVCHLNVFNQGPSPAELSPLCHTQQTHHTPHTPFACSCSNASIFPYPCQNALAGAVATLTHWATTGQLVPERGFCEPGASLWSKPLPEYAEQARARVTTHTRVSDLNPPTVQQVDDQGLPLYNGSQLAIGTTLVAPLASAGQTTPSRQTIRSRC